MSKIHFFVDFSQKLGGQPLWRAAPGWYADIELDLAVVFLSVSKILSNLVLILSWMILRQFILTSIEEQLVLRICYAATILITIAQKILFLKLSLICLESIYRNRFLLLVTSISTRLLTEVSPLRTFSPLISLRILLKTRRGVRPTFE